MVIWSPNTAKMTTTSYSPSVSDNDWDVVDEDTVSVVSYKSDSDIVEIGRHHENGKSIEHEAEKPAQEQTKEVKCEDPNPNPIKKKVPFPTYDDMYAAESWADQMELLDSGFQSSCELDKVGGLAPLSQSRATSPTCKEPFPATLSSRETIESFPAPWLKNSVLYQSMHKDLTVYQTGLSAEKEQTDSTTHPVEKAVASTDTVKPAVTVLQKSPNESTDPTIPVQAQLDSRPEIKQHMMPVDLANKPPAIVSSHEYRKRLENQGIQDLAEEIPIKNEDLYRFTHANEYLKKPAQFPDALNTMSGPFNYHMNCSYEYFDPELPPKLVFHEYPQMLSAQAQRGVPIQTQHAHARSLYEMYGGYYGAPPVYKPTDQQQASVVYPTSPAIMNYPRQTTNSRTYKSPLFGNDAAANGGIGPHGSAALGAPFTPGGSDEASRTIDSQNKMAKEACQVSTESAINTVGSPMTKSVVDSSIKSSADTIADSDARCNSTATDGKKEVISAPYCTFADRVKYMESKKATRKEAFEDYDKYIDSKLCEMTSDSPKFNSHLSCDSASNMAITTHLNEVACQSSRNHGESDGDVNKQQDHPTPTVKEDPLEVWKNATRESLRRLRAMRRPSPDPFVNKCYMNVGEIHDNMPCKIETGPFGEAVCTRPLYRRTDNFYAEAKRSPARNNCGAKGATVPPQTPTRGKAPSPTEKKSPASRPAAWGDNSWTANSVKEEKKLTGLPNNGTAKFFGDEDPAWALGDIVY